MPNYKLTLSYDGSRYNGWQKQGNTDNTIQQRLETLLTRLLAQPVEVAGSGRTDAGVHARAQVVSFDISPDELRDRTLESLARSMNALTHEAIVVRSVDERELGFSARFDATEREYRYFICVDPAPPIFLRDFSWHIPKPLDVEAMREASRTLIGEHDFKSFCMAASAVGKPTCRNVHEISFAQEEVMGERAVVITVKGNAFLHSMVRTIVGTLVMVGRGQRKPEWVADVLQACDRCAAGENAPAAGLVFWNVSYDGVRDHI